MASAPVSTAPQLQPPLRGELAALLDQLVWAQTPHAGAAQAEARTVPAPFPCGAVAHLSARLSCLYPRCSLLSLRSGRRGLGVHSCPPAPSLSRTSGAPDPPCSWAGSLLTTGAGNPGTAAHLPAPAAVWPSANAARGAHGNSARHPQQAGAQRAACLRARRDRQRSLSGAAEAPLLAAAAPPLHRRPEHGPGVPSERAEPRNATRDDGVAGGVAGSSQCEWSVSEGAPKSTVIALKPLNLAFDDDDAGQPDPEAAVLAALAEAGACAATAGGRRGGRGAKLTRLTKLSARPLAPPPPPQVPPPPRCGAGGSSSPTRSSTAAKRAGSTRPA
jgi:hypothetical protein